ncbi:hypothetical protein LWI29_021906 [Acer saccharum]|uniref:Uncharacterized protein n=1 Tax=Acer saccharum TaxID=4024 RepID=A0AA39V8L4_ACESA|nr:hypothetical protein LWI29_021906 [Acer saccharum]
MEIDGSPSLVDRGPLKDLHCQSDGPPSKFSIVEAIKSIKGCQSLCNRNLLTGFRHQAMEIPSELDASTHSPFSTSTSTSQLKLWWLD